MKNCKKRWIAVALIFALCVSAVNVNSRDAEAGIFSWAAKKIVKRGCEQN